MKFQYSMPISPNAHLMLDSLKVVRKLKGEENKNKGVYINEKSPAVFGV